MRTSTEAFPRRRPGETAFGFEDAEELDLEFDRHLGDFVEEERASESHARSRRGASSAPVKLPRS